MKKKILIIAEAGVNHNGSLALAKQLIDAAADAGADAVKFQTFDAEKMVTSSARLAPYQVAACGKVEGQYEMLKRLELDWDAHLELYRHAVDRKISFLSTAFDNDSLAALHHLGVSMFKIPSGEITNYPLLVATAALGRPIILSTGMAGLAEIEAALNVLLEHGSTLNSITVLHCTTAYPTPLQDVNLTAMQTIEASFPGIAVGYSDHTLGITVPIAASAMGATIIEKHFTLDRSMEGPDHKASLEPPELKQMVSAIREVEQAMGCPWKRPGMVELLNMEASRKSLVAMKRIEKGELFSVENVTIKRPGSGLSPMRWNMVMGGKAKRVFLPDELIEL